MHCLTLLPTDVGRRLGVRAGERKSSDGHETFKFPLNFPRTYTPTDAKPLVVCSGIFQSFHRFALVSHRRNWFAHFVILSTSISTQFCLKFYADSFNNCLVKVIEIFGFLSSWFNFSTCVSSSINFQFATSFSIRFFAQNSNRSNFHFRLQARFNPIKSDKFSVIFKFSKRCCPLNVCQSDIFFPKSLRVTVQAQKLTRSDSLSSFRFSCPMLEIDSQSKTL